MNGASQPVVGLKHAAKLRSEWRTILRDLRGEVREKRLVSHASAISYQLLFALVPLALFGLAFASLLGQRELWNDELAKQARNHLSPTAFRLLDGTVEQIMSSKRTLWLTAGLALALWKLSAAARVTMDALDEIYETGVRQSFARRLPRSLALAVVAGTCLILAAAIVVAGGRAARGDVLPVLSFLLRWTLTVGLVLLAAALILRFAPAKRQPLAWVTVGSVLVTAAWIVASLLFGFYAERLAKWETLFGGLTTAIVVMVYLYVSAMVFLIGAEIDARLREETDGVTRAGRAIPPGEDARPATAADAPGPVRGA
ncbi:MAG: YihY/virulence factor BrkB family protein [Thermoleophilia bacterium]|nr:YihY/virulence factor BrkB family protein [Thermoleophilia bacterium]